ncbi:MAG: hypothetical protein ABSH16_12615, partial [Sedimentisphaerales bacterium]
LCGTLLAGKSADSLDQTAQNRLIAQGPNVVIRIDGNSFEVTGKYLDDLKKAVENFGSNLLWPDQNLPVSSTADNLKNMAVIEAAYLSARTGMPEQPAKILKIA